MLTCTKGRHQHIERLVRFSLNQTYSNILHLIYNNSPISQSLGSELPKEKYILVNNHLNLKTWEPYNNLGEIYRDAMTFVPKDIDVVNFSDDDDIYLPNHIEEGINGLERGGLLAYKPQKSWFRYLKELHLAENTLEPSIFVRIEHVKKHGFSSETTAQHLQWVSPLVSDGQIFVDPNAKPTFICDWSQEIPTFKTSGNPNNPANFANYTKHSQDHGDRIISPCSQKMAEHYYKTK